jgi:hypothetical protein
MNKKYYKKKLLYKMEVKATFSYLTKSIQVKCKDDELIQKMFESFASELKDGSEWNHYIYYYEGKKLGHGTKICEDKYIAHKKEITITAQKKLRVVKCPKCKCNDCIVNLKDYVLSYYGCKYNHTFTTVYDEYINDQKIDTSELRCNAPGCDRTQQNYALGFYKCLTCSDLVSHSTYFCKEHKELHEQDHETVKYDKKNYYCEKHFKPFVKYCFTHKENLCEECSTEHKEHKVMSYESMVPNIDKLKESLKAVESNIVKLRIIIDDLKTRLDGALRIFRRYSYIANDVIGKYELFNTELKNYRILKSLRNLQSTNITMNKNLNEIIKEKDPISRINSLIHLYELNEANYKKNNITIDISKENDDDWWDEITKNEKVRESGSKEEKEKKKTKK